MLRSGLAYLGARASDALAQIMKTGSATAYVRRGQAAEHHTTDQAAHLCMGLPRIRTGDLYVAVTCD